MPKYVSAKEFRQRFPDIVKDLKQWGEIVVLKRSKPLFKVVPFEDYPSDLLDRADVIQDTGRPELREIARIVHKLRKIS
jgi:prevent-host-death family protein